MKYIEVKYTRLLGEILALNAFTSISTKRLGNKDTLCTDREKKGREGYKKIGSNNLYGSALSVEGLLKY